MAFVLANLFRAPDEHTAYYNLAFTSHLFVMAIVTSAVSVITSFGRILTGRIPNFLRDGRAPLLLVMFLLVVLAYSVSLYALVEAHVAVQATPALSWLAYSGLAASLSSSLYMEIAIARLHELANRRKAPARKGKGVKGSESSASLVVAPGDSS